MHKVRVTHADGTVRITKPFFASGYESYEAAKKVADKFAVNADKKGYVGIEVIYEGNQDENHLRER